MVTYYILIIAHPDDESMFFLPTICRYIETKSNSNTPSQFHILCLSNGNYNGLGSIRSQELNTAMNFVSNHTFKVTIVDEPDLQDGPKEVWKEESIHREIVRLMSNFLSISSSKEQQYHEIKLITFDQGGISGHPNHIDTYKGVTSFHHKVLNAQAGIQSITDTQLDDKIKTTNLNYDLYVLETISNPIVKYFPFYIWVKMLFCHIMMILFNCVQKQSIKNQTFLYGSSHSGITVNQIFHPRLVWRSMAMHSSQFVWYRRLSVLFSHYTYINRLREIKATQLLAEKKHS